MILRRMYDLANNKAGGQGNPPISSLHLGT